MSTDLDVWSIAQLILDHQDLCTMAANHPLNQESFAYRLGAKMALQAQIQEVKEADPQLFNQALVLAEVLFDDQQESALQANYLRPSALCQLSEGLCQMADYSLWDPIAPTNSPEGEKESATGASPSTILHRTDSSIVAASGSSASISPSKVKEEATQVLLTSKESSASSIPKSLMECDAAFGPWDRILSPCMGQSSKQSPIARKKKQLIPRSLSGKLEQGPSDKAHEVTSQMSSEQSERVVAYDKYLTQVKNNSLSTTEALQHPLAFCIDPAITLPKYTGYTAGQDPVSRCMRYNNHPGKKRRTGNPPETTGGMDMKDNQTSL